MTKSESKLNVPASWVDGRIFRIRDSVVEAWSSAKLSWVPSEAATPGEVALGGLPMPKSARENAGISE